MNRGEITSTGVEAWSAAGEVPAALSAEALRADEDAALAGLSGVASCAFAAGFGSSVGGAQTEVEELKGKVSAAAAALADGRLAKLTEPELVMVAMVSAGRTDPAEFS